MRGNTQVVLIEFVLYGYNRTETIKQTTFFVVTQSFTFSCDLQITKSSTQVLRIYTGSLLKLIR